MSVSYFESRINADGEEEIVLVSCSLEETKTKEKKRKKNEKREKICEDCVICFHPLRSGGRVSHRMLVCDHSVLFHSVCLRKWLSRKKQCPYCNASVVM